MSTNHAKYGMTYSATFRQLAAHAAHRARADLDNPTYGKHLGRDGQAVTHTPRAAEAVILAATALEAGINEMVSWVQRMSIATMPEEYSERIRLTEKWSTLPRAMVGKEFDCGARPWQDFRALVGLRDQLIHYKWDGADVPALVRALQSRDLTLPADPAIYWVDAVLTDRVAVWASATCEQMFGALALLIGKTDELEWPWQ